MSAKKAKLTLPWGQKTCRCPKHKVTLRDRGDGNCVCWKCEQEGANLVIAISEQGTTTEAEVTET